MRLTADQGPLSDTEMDRLQGLLALRPKAMNMEAMDGFFSALIAGPEVVMPGEALPEVLGEGIGESCPSIDEARELMTLMMRRWNDVARVLANDDVPVPILLERNGQASPANDWANGFIRGTQMSRGWEVLFADQEHGPCMLPALILHHEQDPDPTMRPPGIAPEKRKNLIADLMAGLVYAYRYFRGDQYPSAAAALASADIGRNASCPCGSGKRYKRCCGRIM